MATAMNAETTFPWPGILLALGTTAVLSAAGLNTGLALLLLLVWIGSLWLVLPRDEALPQKPAKTPFSREGMAEIIEHSGTPLVITQRNRIIIANRAAREVLGNYIIEQDVRMAFRHPEAIAMMDRSTPGDAIVTGLVRPKDIWRISRYQMDEKLAVIELINKTAEADISRAHTDFVANASHELRTPLASIIGYVETLSEDPAGLDTATARKFLDTIHREARRLQALVSDLMSLSRIEAEKHERPQTRVELHSLVDRAARDAAMHSGREGRLDLQIEGEFEIAGDRQQLEQLVRNLVDNAFNYGGDESDVTVRLFRARNGDAHLNVIDRGDGIAPEHVPHLTRRFYRTDPGRSLATGGTGLGLAIVKHIVQRHRGRLDIASELGQGTTISVRFPPLDEQDSKASRATANDSAEGGG
jgi:two-component system, OmpR family, phosphate regulon sensor histidine kinase PhoR